jgi:hypothetical protein
MSNANALIAAAPACAEAWLLSGIVHYVIGRLRESLVQLNHALAMNPMLGVVWCYRAFVFELVFDFEEAVRCAAVCCFDADRVKEWRSYCVDTSEPGSPAAVATAKRTLAGWLRVDGSPADVVVCWNEAVDVLDEGLRMHPDAARLSTCRAWLLLGMFKIARAEQSRYAAMHVDGDPVHTASPWDVPARAGSRPGGAAGVAPKGNGIAAAAPATAAAAAPVNVSAMWDCAHGGVGQQRRQCCRPVQTPRNGHREMEGFRSDECQSARKHRESDRTAARNGLNTAAATAPPPAASGAVGADAKRSAPTAASASASASTSAAAAAHTAALTKSEIEKLKVSELRRLLHARGIDTEPFAEKSDFVAALMKLNGLSL